MTQRSSNPPALTSLVALLATLSGVPGCGGVQHDSASPASASPPSAPGSKTAPTSATAAPGRDWVRRSDLPMLDGGITSFGAAELDGTLYVLGGYAGTPHAYDHTGQTGRLRALELATGVWRELPEVAPLQSVALVALSSGPGRGLIRVGGMRAVNEPGTPADLRSTDEVERFDPATKAWTPLAALPRPRSSHDATVVGERVYVMGGWQLGGSAGTGAFEREALVLEPDGKWRALPQPFSRRALALAAAGTTIVAAGGLDESGKPSRRVDLFDTRDETWRRGPDLPGEGFGVALSAVGERIFASGMDGAVFELDLERGRWSAIDQLYFPRFFHQLVPTPGGDALLAVGGIHGMTTEDRIRAIETIPLDPEAREAAQVVTWELDAPGPARNRQASFVRGDSLFLFGGNVSTGQHDFEPEHFTDAGLRLHLTSMRWSTLRPFPTRRQSMVTATLGGDGEAIALGGFGHDGEAARTHPEQFRYDAAADRWRATEGALPPGGRTQFGLAEHDGTLWIFGGLDFDPRRAGADMFRHLLPVLRAPAGEPSVGFEPSGVELPEPRRAFAGTTHDGRYYMTGGMREGFTPVSSFVAYDFGAEAWVELARPSATRIGADLVAVGGQLFLVGGTVIDGGGEGEGDGASRKVEVYDVARDRWSVAVDELPLDMRHARAYPYGDNLLVVSTHDEAPIARVAMIKPRPR